MIRDPLGEPPWWSAASHFLHGRTAAVNLSGRTLGGRGVRRKDFTCVPEMMLIGWATVLVCQDIPGNEPRVLGSPLA